MISPAEGQLSQKWLHLSTAEAQVAVGLRNEGDMIPVLQTRLTGPKANCFVACLASILELPIERVPDFYEIGADGKEAMTEVQRWLINRGLQLVALKAPTHLLPMAHLIAEGPSPRGRKHAMVYFGANPIHDPHPDGSGLIKVDLFRVFVATHPNKVNVWDA